MFIVKITAQTHFGDEKIVDIDYDGTREVYNGRCAGDGIIDTSYAIREVHFYAPGMPPYYSDLTSIDIADATRFETREEAEKVAERWRNEFISEYGDTSFTDSEGRIHIREESTSVNVEILEV